LNPTGESTILLSRFNGTHHSLTSQRLFQYS
jgi:hypothetical protein